MTEQEDTELTSSHELRMPTIQLFTKQLSARSINMKISRKSVPQLQTLRRNHKRRIESLTMQYSQDTHQGRLLLLLLSHFSHVRLSATPQIAAHQAPPSLGFSRQEHWSGLPFPSSMHESEVKVKSLSRVRLLVTTWTAAYQAPPSMGFSRQEYWSGVTQGRLTTYKRIITIA